MQQVSHLLGELWKRRVVQFGALYLATAWVLLQVVLAVTQTLHLPDWVGQTALLFLAFGFPLLIILAWTREPVAETPSPSTVTKPPIAAETIAVAPERSDKVSICVLPFSNISGDIEQEYFSDGISEDIITDLSKVSSVMVVARNTAFQFKGRSVDVPQIARQLKVSHVLEGSVRKSGGRVRITAQLIDGGTGGHVWAERYDRDLSDIFVLQDEISKAIVDALKLKLLPEEKKAIAQRGTDSVEAYDVYLMARQSYIGANVGNARPWEAVIRLCKRAIEIDPNYARAWALMARTQEILSFYHGRKDETGLVAAERAIALDNTLSEAHSAKAEILTRRGRPEEALAEVEHALRLDPESYEANLVAGMCRYQLHRFEDAIRYWEKAAALMEADFVAAGMLVSCYVAAGNRDGACRAAKRALPRIEKVLVQERDNGSALSFGVGALAVLGEAERAKEWIKRALLLDPDNVNMRYNFACAFITDLHEVDAGLDLLATTLDGSGSRLLPIMRADPDLDPVRDHPRFKAMIGAAEARLAAGDAARASPLPPASLRSAPLPQQDA